ncbi:hypothetical protein A7A78_01740 [Aequorivita soesokkakensis]|uniref:RES domain-containing protein n=1 Tax=Aequorivita soesokkakensis TaxID=1385699 RepID=A0A1A9LJG5_9FLAO|nr:RES family NAD+ phosphorylase [Aequorivita soesokkakensis]OAD92655.1 hypothetical protein A7A78_01740 [Aequorivita soesokkakensis]
MKNDELIEYSKTATIEDIKKIIAEKLTEAKYSSILCKNQKFKGFYRARKHQYFNGDSFKGEYSVFISENEFWNPPAKKIFWNGRCNRAGKSTFYASTQFETAIKEVRPEVGKFITVCTFEPRIVDEKLPSFKIKPIAIQHLKKIEGVHSCIENFEPSKQPKEFKEVDDFLDKLFTHKVTDDEHYYKITNAITECMLVKVMDDNGEPVSMNGMIYPSISDNLNGMNLILRPIDAHLHYDIKSIQTFYVESFIGDKFQLVHVRNGLLPKEKEFPDLKYDIEWTENIAKDKTLV